MSSSSDSRLSQDSQSFQWHYAEFDDTSFQIRGRTIFFISLLLSVIIFIILLFLYSRWACRFPTPPAARHAAHAPPPQQHRGLDPSTINSLPIILHESSSPAALRQVDECVICLGIFQDGEKVKLLPDCHHCYHSECVDKWLRTQSSCPLCRASLRADFAV